jgi:hypothetical protein
MQGNSLRNVGSLFGLLNSEVSFLCSVERGSEDPQDAMISEVSRALASGVERGSGFRPNVSHCVEGQFAYGLICLVQFGTRLEIRERRALRRLQ